MNKAIRDTQNFETCQQCNGHGFEWDFDPDARKSIKIECSHCDGDGYEPNENDDDDETN